MNLDLKIFRYLSLLKPQSRKQKLILILSLLRRAATKFLGAHQLDAPHHYCSGYGIEIGAASSPYIFPSMKVDYADYFNQSRKSLLDKRGFFHLDPPKCLLSTISDSKYDFLYASHVLEHSANPMRTLEEWVRVVKESGIIYIVVPNKLKIYDVKREPTPLTWFINRYDNDLWDFDLDEIQTMVDMTEKLPNYDVPESEKKSLYRHIKENPDGNHHYSVYDPISMIQFSNFVGKKFNLDILNIQIIRHEIHLVMKKLPLLRPIKFNT